MGTVIRVVAIGAVVAMIAFFVLPPTRLGDATGSPSVTERGDRPYQVSWIGNTFPGKGREPSDSDHVQQNCNAAYVAADGLVICNSRWDEGTKEAGVYQDGKSVGMLQDVHCCGGYAVTGDERFFYLAAEDEAGTRTIRQYDNNTYASLRRAPSHGNALVVGLAVVGSEVFASSKDHNRVDVYRTSDLAYLRSFPVDGPSAMASDHGGRLWIATRRMVAAYSTAGADLHLSVTDTVDPTAVAVDPQGELLVGDDGPQRQQVYVYDISGPPRRVEAIGAPGGMYAGPVPGRAGPLRFNGITGLGKDARGTLIVAQDHVGDSAYAESAGTGTNIDAYVRRSESWVRAWQLLGLQFVDMADVDVASYRYGVIDAYTADDHFSIDFTKPPGQQWSWVGILRNRFAYPHDARLAADVLSTPTVPSVVTLGGQKFLAVTNMYADGLILYGFVKGTEYTVEGARLAVQRARFDSHGDVWSIDDQGISRTRFTGLDENGAPTFGRPTAFGMPHPFTVLGRERYDPATDAMYLSGFTADRPAWAGADKVMGTVLARYDNWTAGNRTATWTTILPYTRNGTIHGPTALGLVSMDIAGDGRIYTTTLTHERGETQSRVYQYDEATGSLIGSWIPGPGLGSTGWVDVMDGIRARRLPTGDTVVFQEDDYRAKTVMYLVPPGR
jgi:hypothetical protein